MVRQYFQLNAKEKKQEWLMLGFALAAFITIGIGVYTQTHQINKDYILIPLCMAMFGCYTLIYSINGFTSGNLVYKWTPFFIFQLIVFLIKTVASTAKEKATILSTKLLAVAGLIVSIIMFAFAALTLIKPN